jgi:SAM-dependent methyltransferase
MRAGIGSEKFLRRREAAMNTEFNDRSQEYAIGRPSYPLEILQILTDLGIGERSTIADIGAGTGLLTKIVGELGSNVLGIEPDEEMMNEGRNYCTDNQNIKFIHASAEDTGLEDTSVDLITIAQAFHWFDKHKCKEEFKRILKEDGYVMIVFNEMQRDSRLAQEYTDVLHQFKAKHNAGISDFDPDEEKRRFFGQGYSKILFDYGHTLTEEAFIGGALSLSYTPSKKDTRYEEFVAALRKLFSYFQKDGAITFQYKTEVCVCRFLQEGKD